MLWVVKHKICQTYGFQISSLSLTIFVAMGIFHCNWTLTCKSNHCWGFPHSSVGKESACNAGNPGSTPGSGTSTGDGIGYPLQSSWASPVAQLVKNPPAMWETWVGKIPWRRERLPTPVFWPGEFRGLSPSGCRVRHNWVTFTFTILSLQLLSGVWLCDLTGLLCPWNFPGKNSGVGCPFLLGGSSRPRDWTLLLHWPAGSLPQSHLGNPQIKNHITN